MFASLSSRCFLISESLNNSPIFSYVSLGNKTPLLSMSLVKRVADLILPLQTREEKTFALSLSAVVPLLREKKASAHDIALEASICNLPSFHSHKRFFHAFSDVWCSFCIG